MCDPMTLLGLAGAAFGLFGGGGKSDPAPPTPAIVNTPQSAISAPLGRSAGAAVRIGTKDEAVDKPVLETTGTDKFPTKRQTAKLSVGNLGRAGLEL